MIYHLDLFSNLTNKTWIVPRSLFQFKQFFNHLKEHHFNLPQFPGNLYVNNLSNPFDKQRQQLEEFLKNILDRSDLINSLIVKNFLELENHFPDYMIFQPLLLVDIKDYKMEVTDVHFCSLENLLFIGYANSSTTGRLSSYLNSLSSLWESSYMGAMSIYHMAKSNYGEVHMQRLFLTEFYSQVSKLYYIESHSMLLLGLYDGTLLIFKVYTNLKEYISKELVEKPIKLRPHKSRIIDFGADISVGYIYTAAYGDNKVSVSEVNYETVITSIPVSRYNLTTFHYENASKRIFFTDEGNSLWILQIIDYVIILLNDSLFLKIGKCENSSCNSQYSSWHHFHEIRI
jgi:hypothetical protein